MTSQKFIKYTPLDINGKLLNSTQELTLKVLEESGNYLLHKDLLRHSTLKRQGTVSTKTRSEVRGGGRKPWKQKGTGRARAGSNRSPLWKGGGVIFGPKPKIVSFKLNKKERRLAFQTLLYNKKNNILIIENLEDELIEFKTKKFLTICKNCQIDVNQKILLVVSRKTAALKSATQNLKDVELILASNLNTFSFLKAKQILITSLAINDIKETYCE
jgi:large subunit ribosomal protein L4